MTKEERIKVYDKATQLWGFVAQYDQCIEEMAELTVAINKYKRKVLYSEYLDNKNIEENLVEEIADVCICIEQLKHFFESYNIDEVIEKKMIKFLGQIEKNKGKNK